MDKKLLLTTALCAVSTAFALEPWYGDTEFIKTGLDNGLETSGYWYTFDDRKNGGESIIIMPTQTQAYEATDDYVLSDVILQCAGVCGEALLKRDTLPYQGFAGVAFNVVGESSPTDRTPAVGDASSWEGICITYTSEVLPSIELGLSEDVEASIGKANPAYSLLPKASVPVTKNIAWSDFTQPSWYIGEKKMSGIEAAKQLTSIRFKMQAKDGKYSFNISRIDSYSNCKTSNIKTVQGTSAARANLFGRTLEFTGVSTATAEVINLQGQVVAKSSIDNTASTLNLATLDAGIYMVRVAGKAVNFTKKIVLK